MLLYNKVSGAMNTTYFTEKHEVLLVTILPTIGTILPTIGTSSK